MNALSNLGKQISDLLVSLTPQARIMAGLMVGVIVVSLGWIVSSQQSSSYEYLLGGIHFSDTQLDRVETAFGDAQLRNYVREGKRIRIPVGEKDEYLKALSAGDALPKEWGSEMEQALTKGNVFESSEKFAVRAETARERELAYLLRMMPGIEFAAVEYDEQRRGFGRQAERVCSINLRGVRNARIDEAVMKRIARNASKYFANLPLENIAVFDLGSSNIYQASGDPDSAEEQPYLVAQTQWVRAYEDKISEALSMYGDISLMVNVELDPTLREESERLQYDPTAVALQSSTSRKDSENQKGPAGGRPGANPNAGFASNQGAQLSAGAGDQTSVNKETEESERRVAGHEATLKKTAGLVPTKVSVSVGIPDSYFREVFAHNYLQANPGTAPADVPAPTPAEIDTLVKDVTASIKNSLGGIILGVREGDDRQPYIDVHTYADLPPPALPKPSMAENALGWLSASWSTLALMGLVLVSLGMMFSWVRSQGEPANQRSFEEGFGLEVPSEPIDELELDEDGEPITDGKREIPALDMTGGEIKEDLSTLIKQNPDAAVNLLKTWIGDAA